MNLPITFRAHVSDYHPANLWRPFWDNWGWIGVAIGCLTFRLWWTGGGTTGWFRWELYEPASSSLRTLPIRRLLRIGTFNSRPTDPFSYLLIIRIGRAEFHVCLYTSNPLTARPDIWGSEISAPRTTSRAPFRHLREYFRARTFFQSAADQVRLHGLSVVLPSMRQLNRHAALRGVGTRHIYQLKNHLIRHLYETGRCVRLTQERQEMRCRGCFGTGDNGYGDGWCPRCDGTGVYKTHTLYHFRFEYQSLLYDWHQPAALVDWPVTLTDDTIGEYHAWAPSASELPPTQQTGLSAIVYTYLRQIGIPADSLPAVPTFTGAIRRELDDTFGRPWRYFTARFHSRDIPF